MSQSVILGPSHSHLFCDSLPLESIATDVWPSANAKVGFMVCYWRFALLSFFYLLLFWGLLKVFFLLFPTQNLSARLALWFATEDLASLKQGWLTAVECGDRGSGEFAIEVSFSPPCFTNMWNKCLITMFQNYVPLQCEHCIEQVKFNLWWLCIGYIYPTPRNALFVRPSVTFFTPSNANAHQSKLWACTLDF